MSKKSRKFEWEKAVEIGVDGENSNFSKFEEKNGIIQVFGMNNYCNEGVDGEIDNFWRVEEDDRILLSFSSYGMIWVFGTDSYFNEGVDRKTINSLKVKEDDGIILGFSDVITNYKNSDINRFIADIGHINSDW